MRSFTCVSVFVRARISIDKKRVEVAKGKGKLADKRSTSVCPVATIPTHPSSFFLPFPVVVVEVVVVEEGTTQHKTSKKAKSQKTKPNECQGQLCNVDEYLCKVTLAR